MNIITGTKPRNPSGSPFKKEQREYTRSQFAKIYYNLAGRPFSFEQRRWLVPIFDTPAPRVLLRTGRQVSKSTSQAAILLADSAFHPHFRTLYAAPTGQQVQEFSNLRLGPMIKDSPRFRGVYWAKNCIDQMRNRSLINRSHITLGSAFRSADSLRGISSDRLCIDEVQDIITENIKIIEETLFASEYQYYFYCGTPKTTSSSIETYWRASTQNYWAVKCIRCNYWNYPLGEKNMHPDGLICNKCRRQIEDVIGQGQWVHTHANASWVGWHISQLMCPWAPWENIYAKYEGPTSMPRKTFFNEVLGFPFDIGIKPLTEDEIKANCDPEYSLKSINIHIPETAQSLPPNLFGGLDWAQQSSDISVAPSYTILTIGGFVHDRLKIIHIKKFMGQESADPDYVLQTIMKTCHDFNIRLLGCDWGIGHKENLRIGGAIGRKRVVECRYTNQARKARWDKDRASLNLNRTQVMDDVFHAIKQQHYIFPKWDEFSSYAGDITGIFSDPGNRYIREIRYDHADEDPDDFLHSLVYLTMMSRLFFNNLDIDEKAAVETRGGYVGHN